MIRVLLKITLLSIGLFLVHGTHVQGTCPGFGNNGVARSLGSHSTQLNALASLPNGRIIAVGWHDNAGEKDMLVARFHSTGAPDLTFSPTGVRSYDISLDYDDEALCVAVAPDGNILIGGIAGGYGSIIKINSQGNLVSSFGTGGKVKYDQLYSTVEDILVTPQGTIYGVGKGFDTDNIVFRKLKVQAYNSNGTLLTSFADNGKYTRTDFVVWHKTTVAGALQSDGKIIVGGTTPSASNLLDKWFLVRLNTDGSSDVTFHDDGLVEDPETATAYLKDVVVGTDGSIYVGGFENLDSGFPTLAVAKKFKPDGNSDNSFNMTGTAWQRNHAMAYAITTDADGKVYFVGSFGEANDNKDFIIGSFDANGEPDFDVDYMDKLPGTTHGELLNMIRLSDGSFVACGYAVGYDQRYGVLRKYNADGTLNEGFNKGGANFVRHTDGNTNDVVVQADGKILAGGTYVHDGSNTGVSVARFLADGSPDLSFGTYGYVRYDLSETREFLFDLHAYPDGKILIGGSTYGDNSGEDFLVARLNADGSLDDSFGTNGFVTHHVGAYAKHNRLNAFKVDQQGRILIAGDGNFDGGSYHYSTLMRLLPNGARDPDFAVNGVFNINLTVVHDFFYDVVIAEDGSIYAAGYGMVNVGGAVVKLNDAGILDTSFGIEGVFYTDWKEGHISAAMAIELQEDGKLVVGCSQELKSDATETNAFIYRLLPSGETDQTFGENGIVEVPFSSVRGLVIHDDIIYLSGSSSTMFYMSRLNPDGSPYTHLMSNSNYTSDTDLAINRTTGNIYTGAIFRSQNGITVACIGSSGVEEDEEEEDDECDHVSRPTITMNGDALFSSEADSYQWYASGELLEGETSQSLLIDPVVGGVFSVEVAIGECFKSSD